MKINIIRRISQVAILLFFILGNLGILPILKGDLSSSMLFGKIPLSDPFAVLQIYLATFSINSVAITGALIIFLVYALVAPRAFCAWVCPINLITDFAYFIRKKLSYSKDRNFLNIPKSFRYYFLALSLILSFVLSMPAFENISFIGVVQRGIIFTNSVAIGIIFAIFVFDTFIVDRGICSRICPLGAFYAVIGKFSLIRVEHIAQNCTKCMDCKVVCPEVDVLKMVGKNDGFVASECISCGRCVDICQHNALNFSIKNNKEG
ncbi:quinol dehydrogenase ferredoxin subunit NapH [Campylobacter geochelonis]|uniref:quinol dehydrogenase ferredoxin subunit NapH n=1 Tax=Campylobacter geochelonis TaxID=1780362 RepID=UPI00077075E2|nr:quinol dehydrogenase ferredoxin subunit NapH [Campylobacter geochelonis]CZE48493.1 NapH/MauN family ferredoxin-type protein [Campylobacter geochelonis]